MIDQLSNNLNKIHKFSMKDITGYPLTCRSEAALQSFNEGVLAYISFRENGLPYLNKALELDDSIVLAHCLLVRDTFVRQILVTCNHQ